MTVAGALVDWDRYERWNAAIADVVYSRDAGGSPVYLDLEDDVVDAIRDVAEPDAPNAIDALIEAVKHTLVLDRGASDVLRGHLHRLNTWQRGDRTNPPPTLGLLAILSLAAEKMHEGGGKAAHNFYGRLGELLDLTDEETDRFIDAYRKQRKGEAVSKELWGSVNEWLEMLEGNRGLPTSFALAHAHIGLPLSQALVRQTDREKFGDMFTIYGLAPHSALPPVEMEQLIDEWLARRPCPASNSIERMWDRDATARERIVDVARLTLEAWEGPAESTSESQTDQIRVKALLRTFPTRQLEITLVLPARSEAVVETVEVLDEEGSPIASLDLVPASSGWLTLADPSDIDTGSFLRGEARLRRKGQTQPLRRRPRRLVPTRRDDMLQAFVECERVQLGEDALILVRSEIAANVGQLLDVAARPGFTEETSLPGLPDGWTLFDQVQILSSIPADLLKNRLVDLNLLQPLATSQVVLQGGLRLPGNIRKWSSARPPELRASTDSGSTSARLTCTRPLSSPTPPDVEMESEDAVLIWDFATAHLADGDYEINVSLDGGSPTKPEMLRLRSADNPAIAIDTTERNPIGHDPAAAAFGLIARRTRAAKAVRGVPVDGKSLERGPAPRAGTPGWYDARRSSPRVEERNAAIAFPEAGATCMATGAHHMMVETAHRGQATVEGVCKHCGLVKRYPTRFKQKPTRKGSSTPRIAPRLDVHELDAVKQITVDWQAGFDAVCHVGGGPISYLERIATQMEPSELFRLTFARRLENLGHIEIERDPGSLLATSWEVIEPTLVGLRAGEIVLIGFRSDRMMVAIEDLLHTLHAHLTIDGSIDAPSVVNIAGLSNDGIFDMAKAIEKAAEKHLFFTPNAAERLAAQLPPLSRALAGLPTTPMIGARSYERWDPITARFGPVSDAGRPGAYRLTGFKRAYIYRRAEDLGSMSAVLGDAQIVKYAAALDSKQSLLGYDSSAEVLYVPLGADLPGLYGRAATLASGYPPTENTAERILEYRRVPPALAGQLTDLLMA
jgi:hypothetical protein